MAEYNFWKHWKRITPIERRAIRAVMIARKLLVAAIPAKALVGIYLKGSFVRREMQVGSDVDMVPIVTENRYEGLAFNVNVPAVTPVMIVPLSLSEFRTNRLFAKSDSQPDLRAKPDVFLKNLSSFKLIYGRSLNRKKFQIRSTQQLIQESCRVIRQGIVAYRLGKLSFSVLLKETFWLTALQQELHGRHVLHSFSAIDRSVLEPTHLIHTAYVLRMQQTVSPRDQRMFARKLTTYLKSL